jgi:hypothetical protein
MCREDQVAREASGCCPHVVPDQPGRLYSAVGRAVSIAAEGRLRLTTCGKSPAVADPRHSRRGRVADAGGGHRAARSCSGHTRAPRRVGISRRSPGSSYRDDVTTILATGARRWPAQSVSTGGWAANRVRLSSVGSPFPWSNRRAAGICTPDRLGLPHNEFRGWRRQPLGCVVPSRLPGRFRS